MKRININTATAKELTQLAGIGNALAGRIVAHRDEHGPFRSKKDLINVHGVSETLIEGLINRIALSAKGSDAPQAVIQVPDGQWRQVVLSTAETLRAQDLALQHTRHATKRKKKGKAPADDFAAKPVEADSMFTPELRSITAEGLGIPFESMEAVAQVVTRKRGFWEDGRPPVTFMGHRFWRQLKKRGIRASAMQKKFKSILHPHWDPKAVRKGLKEYKRVKKAMRVHPDVALRSTCWGMFQMPGFHYKKLGYENVYDFVKKQQSSELAQLEDFLTLLEHEKIAPHLREGNWKKFARRYFGRGHKQMGFAKKIGKAHRSLTEGTEEESS